MLDVLGHFGKRYCFLFLPNLRNDVFLPRLHLFYLLSRLFKSRDNRFFAHFFSSDFNHVDKPVFAACYQILLKLPTFLPVAVRRFDNEMPAVATGKKIRSLRWIW